MSLLREAPAAADPGRTTPRVTGATHPPSRPGGLRHSTRVLGSIAAVAGRLWVRDTTRSLGVSRTTVALFGLAALAVMVAGSLILTTVMPALPTRDLPPDELARIRALAASLVWTLGSLVTIFFQMLAPRRTALSNVLGLLPVSRTLTAVATQLPMLGVSLVAVASLAAPTVTMLADASRGGLAVAIPAALLLVLGQIPLTALLFNLVVPLVQRLRVPQHHALAAGGFTGVAIAVAAPVLELGGNGSAWLPHRVLAAAADGGAISGGSLLLWSASGLTLFVLLVGRLPADPDPAPSRLFVGYRVPRIRPMAQAWYELVMLARAPQYLAVVVFTGAVFAAVLGAWLATRSSFLPVLAVPLLLPFFIGAVQSYGHTRATHWLSMHLLARPAAWAWPKATVCLAVAALLALPGAVLAASTQLIGWTEVPLLFVQALPAWSAAMVAGLLIPYSTEQPLSVGLSVGLAGIIYLGGLWTVGQLIPQAAVLGQVGMAAVCMSAYFLMARLTRPQISHA
ncbi:hypothetical protein RB614_23220 [Phytohabitans sp. ZYX-F-186]|uniref:ABC transporter permease n=1 Tax=Phytohabitans maris TaxID=3071409 RepID=A0ABU0ZKC7_9ACTN|nr:hypothetical protein [Phytohabitans sp. ZYX-F-186]MDQ7907433.1 hypothetical protein [Phytohabitans sp. ZYX-F-186]